jgi:hypothetical protein
MCETDKADSPMAKKAELKAELVSMKPRDRKKRAEDVGAPKDTIDEATCADNAAEAFCELIMKMAKKAELKAELVSMTPRDRKKRAEEVGASKADIDEATYADKAAEAFCELIMKFEDAAEDKAEDKVDKEEIKRAIRLLSGGLAGDGKIALLKTYFDNVEDKMMKWSHVFISYRKASDKDVAQKLAKNLQGKALASGSTMRVFLDGWRLEDGKRCEDGFVKGLSRSWVFVPIISIANLHEMVRRAEEDQEECDNVLVSTITLRTA